MSTPPDPFQTSRRSILRSPVIQRRFDPHALRACLYSMVRDSYPENAPVNIMIDDATKMLRELSRSAGTQNPEAEVETFIQSLMDARNDQVQEEPEVSLIPGRTSPPEEAEESTRKRAISLISGRTSPPEEEGSPRKMARMEEYSDAEESTMYDGSEPAPLTFVDLKA